MAKKVNNKPKKENKKEFKEKDFVEEDDILDFDEFDDEDEVVVIPSKKEKPVKTVKEEAPKHEVKGEKCSCNAIAKYLPFITCAISLLTLILVIAVLVKVNNLDGTSTKNKTSSGEEQGTEQAEYDTSMFTEIDKDEFVEMFKNKKKYYFVYTGRATCSYCQMMIGNYQKSVEEYDYELYYYDTEVMTQEIVDEVQALDEIFARDFPATPMVYLIGKGEVKAVNEGYTEYETYANFLEENGVDKK